MTAAERALMLELARAVEGLLWRMQAAQRSDRQLQELRLRLAKSRAAAERDLPERSNSA